MPLAERNPFIEFDAWLSEFKQHPGFTYIKSNHGFWDRLSDVLLHMAWPTTDDERMAADRLVNREGQGFFLGGFVDELVGLFANIPKDDRLIFGISLQAWQGSDRTIGIPRRPERSNEIVERLVPSHVRRCDATLMKSAVESGEIFELLRTIQGHRVIVVGPGAISSFLDFAKIEHGCYIEIHPTKGRLGRIETESQIRTAIENAPCDGLPLCVLMQAGTLAPYWALRLRGDYPLVRWVDGGLALSLCYPEHLFPMHWGQAKRREIAATHNLWVGRERYAERPRFEALFDELRDLENGLHRKPAPDTPREYPPPTPPTIGLAENKEPDFGNIERFLALSKQTHHGSDFGQLDALLSVVIGKYAGFDDTLTAIPCASGTLALETLAKIHEVNRGKKLRWIASAFSYFNVNSGHFSGSTLIDCDKSGLLSLDVLKEIDAQSYDGLIVTNPFGLTREFSRFQEFARSSGKLLLIDNAAGFGNLDQTDLPYQSFSFHQTKPFGAAEGGCMLVPKENADLARQLISQGKALSAQAARLSTNAKLSEISAAFILDRLARAPQWVPLYRMQSTRLEWLASDCKLIPLMSDMGKMIAMTLPFLANDVITGNMLANRHVPLAKGYRPLTDQAPVANDLCRRLVNIPCHPQMALLSCKTIREILLGLGR